MVDVAANEVNLVIRDRALQRLSEIFNVPVTALHSKHQFGVDLRPIFVSDFRRNELDMINDDIHDVADKDIIKELASGLLVIRTVGDYCDHMVQCSMSRPAVVARLLELHPKSH